ncbi:MAG: phosphopantetheine-binding protein, partial [Candidatus Binatia bacterium]
LRAPDDTRPEMEQIFVAPRTAVEKSLAGMWADILRLDRVGIHDNFFDLGGHSLLATQVISRMRDAFQVELPLRSLFESPTVGSLAAQVAETLAKQAPAEEMASVLAELESLSEEEAHGLAANPPVAGKP